MKISKKIKGFRRNFIMTQAKYMKNNGANQMALASFLCQKGWNRAQANRDASFLCQKGWNRAQANRDAAAL